MFSNGSKDQKTTYMFQCKNINKTMASNHDEETSVEFPRCYFER